MSAFEVVFSDQALADLESSFEWGCERWGINEATNWYFEIQDAINERLTSFPLGCPPAPGQHRFMAETRVLVIERYNVLFHVSRKQVTITHIRGPFT